MVVQWLSGLSLAFKWYWIGIDLLSGYSLVIRYFEWYSNGRVVVHWQLIGTGLELDWLIGYPLVIRSLEL